MDPAKAVRSALWNAVYAAGVLLLAGGTPTEIEEKGAEHGPGVPAMA